MTKKEVLIQAKAIIERGWCQGTYAIDNDGHPVDFDSQKAVAWCIRGATCLIAPDGYHNRYGAHELIKSITITPISQWNDEPGRTKEEVLDVLTQAIALAGE
jgi:hypothetical protein